MWNGRVMFSIAFNKTNFAVLKVETSLGRFCSLLSTIFFEKYSFHRKYQHLKVCKNYIKTVEHLRSSQTSVA